MTAVYAADQEQTKTQTQDQIQQQIKIQDQERDRTRDRDRIYGSQLMTPQERNDYQIKMRSMKTEQEREAYRLEHHKQMQERAHQRGLNLPDSPPVKGGGMGPGGDGHKGR
jgi:hypothetical protein